MLHVIGALKHELSTFVPQTGSSFSSAHSVERLRISFCGTDRDKQNQAQKELSLIFPLIHPFYVVPIWNSVPIRKLITFSFYCFKEMINPITVSEETIT